MKTMKRIQLGRFPRESQRGLSMIFALIGLVVLTLGGVALVRSVDTGLLTLGNLGFRRDAVASASHGTEQAIDWLWGAGAALTDDKVPDGYYATAYTNLAPQAKEQNAAKTLSLVDWSGDECGGMEVSATLACLKPTKAKELSGGRTVSWVVTRLCAVVGAGGSGRPCVMPLTFSKAVNMDRGALEAQGKIAPTTTTTFYRVIVRATGPRNSVAITETLVHF